MDGLRLAGQRVMRQVAAELAAGRPSWFVALGGSMRPSISFVQRVRLRPLSPAEPLVGRVTLVDVEGRLWLHRVDRERPGEVHVVSDSGMVNGWTARTSVYGVLEEGSATG